MKEAVQRMKWYAASDRQEDTVTPPSLGSKRWAVPVGEARVSGAGNRVLPKVVSTALAGADPS